MARMTRNIRLRYWTRIVSGMRNLLLHTHSHLARYMNTRDGAAGGGRRWWWRWPSDLWRPNKVPAMFHHFVSNAEKQFVSKNSRCKSTHNDWQIVICFDKTNADQKVVQLNSLPKLRLTLSQICVNPENTWWKILRRRLTIRDFGSFEFKKIIVHLNHRRKIISWPLKKIF